MWTAKNTSPRDARGRIAPGVLWFLVLATFSGNQDLRAQETVAWGEELVFHTFSIAAVDPRTGESGVAVTTRVPCVGNGVP